MGIGCRDKPNPSTARAVLPLPALEGAFVRGGKHRLDSPACRVILSRGSDTDRPRQNSRRRDLAGLLRRAGDAPEESRAEATTLKTILRCQNASVSPKRWRRRWAAELSALVDQLDAICRSVDDLTQAAEDAFGTQDRAAVIASFPGVGALTGARLLAEIGTTTPDSLTLEP